LAGGVSLNRRGFTRHWGLVTFPPVRRPILLAVAALAIFGTACEGTNPVVSPGAADLQNGQQLFVTGCGGCHTLANANTKGTIGPNLDAAYAEPALEGWERSSFEALVREQIDWGAASSNPPMPPDIYTGTNADDVAAYVASVAATGSAAPK
jgi:mono/diheme cytochrome c family protein